MSARLPGFKNGGAGFSRQAPLWAVLLCVLGLWAHPPFVQAAGKVDKDAASSSLASVTEREVPPEPERTFAIGAAEEGGRENASETPAPGREGNLPEGGTPGADAADSATADAVTEETRRTVEKDAADAGNGTRDGAVPGTVPAPGGVESGLAVNDDLRAAVAVAPTVPAASAAQSRAEVGSGSAPEERAAAPRPAPGEEKVSASPPVAAGRRGGGAAAGSPEKTPIRLFDTVEFRGKLQNMPKWQRVVAAEAKNPTFDRADLGTLMRGNLHRQWLELVERVKNMSPLEKARAVTVFFNRWPYRTDQELYKVADYWATPAEFLRRSGDCEDYAATKFYALIKLGVDPESMRIVALRDTIRNIAHAVLVLYTEGEAYVLDSLTDLTLPHSRYKHYWPQYSVNEVYRWAHVRPKMK